MNNFECRIANFEELNQRWDDLIAMHPGDNSWKKYKENIPKHRNRQEFSKRYNVDRRKDYRLKKRNIYKTFSRRLQRSSHL